MAQVRTSAFPTDVIKCPGHECGATICTLSADRKTDDATVHHLRLWGWQVVDGQWTCPAHLPPERGGRAMPNPFCLRCGDLRGGPYGHRLFECTFRSEGKSDERG